MYSVFALLSSEVDSKNNITQTLKCLLINYYQSLNAGLGLHIGNSFSADFFLLQSTQIMHVIYQVQHKTEETASLLPIEILLYLTETQIGQTTSGGDDLAVSACHFQTEQIKL